MSLLFDRDYTITVGTVQIKSLRCTFSVKRTLKTTANTVDLKIFNLNETNRKAIEAQTQTTCQIDAGYVGATSTIFLGDLRTHVSHREGPNVVTQLAAGDGERAMQTKRAVQSFGKGSKTSDILTALASALGVDPGNLSQAAAALAPFGGMFSMGTVVCGSAARELTRILKSVGYTWSIQAGKLQILAIGAALATSAVTLASSTGLIDSPTVDKDGMLNCRTLMIPDLFPGRIVVLVAENLSGQFKIQETSHVGDSHGNDWYVDIKAKKY